VQGLFHNPARPLIHAPVYKNMLLFIITRGCALAYAYKLLQYYRHWLSHPRFEQNCSQKYRNNTYTKNKVVDKQTALCMCGVWMILSTGYRLKMIIIKYVHTWLTSCWKCGWLVSTRSRSECNANSDRAFHGGWKLCTSIWFMPSGLSCRTGLDATIGIPCMLP